MRLEAFLAEAEEAGATKIWLYGSLASAGCPGEGSDIDLAISFPGGAGADEAFEALMELRRAQHRVKHEGRERHLHLWIEPEISEEQVPGPRQLLRPLD